MQCHKVPSLGTDSVTGRQLDVASSHSASNFIQSTGERMTPEFAQPVNKIFDAVLDLVDRIERHEQPDLVEEKTLIRMDLDALTAMASNRPGQRLEDFELVRRALS